MDGYIIKELDIGVNFFNIECDVNGGTIEFEFFQINRDIIKKTLELNGIDFDDEEIQENIDNYEY